MKEKVNATGVPETMVQTLYARAKETKKAKCKDQRWDRSKTSGKALIMTFPRRIRIMP